MQRNAKEIEEEMKKRGVNRMWNDQDIMLWGIVFALEDLTKKLERKK